MFGDLKMDAFQVVCGVTGLACVLVTCLYLRLKRLRASFPLLFVFFSLALLLLMLAVFPSAVDRLLPDVRLGRIRAAVVVLTVFIMVITFEAIRRTQIKERYALLWVVPCVGVLLLTAQPVVLDGLRETFGMEYASTMVAVVFVSVMAAVFVLAKSTSVSERNIARLAQRCAMLEARLRNLEKGRQR